jgi:hypothetical protein
MEHNLHECQILGKLYNLQFFQMKIRTERQKDNILHGCGLNMELDPN